MDSMSESDEAVLAEIEEQTGVSYDPDTETVEFTGAPNHTEQYVSLVEYLAENGYITEDDLPISAKRAQTRYLINSTASHEDRDMIRPREVSNRVYLETNHDSSSKARYSARFIKDYVLSGQFRRYIKYEMEIGVVPIEEDNGNRSKNNYRGEVLRIAPRPGVSTLPERSGCGSDS